MSNTHTTTALSAFEIVEIAKSMGLRNTGQIGNSAVWEIAGYTIVGNHTTGDYTISIDGHIQTAGTGNIVDALRAFIEAGE